LAIRTMLVGPACRVFVASIDPNPFVKGIGIRLLKVAGIDANTGVLQEEAVQ
jgi:pyrimidine deaminase RibD-like protein